MRDRWVAGWRPGIRASRFLRSASVGLPSPVQTSASSASRRTRSGMALREQSGAQCARRRAVEQQCLPAGLVEDVRGGRRQVVGAARNIGVDRPPFVGATIPFAIDAPRVVTQAREPVHRRCLGLARNLQVEHRRRRYRRAVHEQDRAAAGRRFHDMLAPQEELDAVGPGLLDRPVGRGNDRILPLGRSPAARASGAAGRCGECRRARRDERARDVGELLAARDVMPA